MSQTQNTVPQPSPAGAPGKQGAAGSSTPRPRGPPLHKIYELPAPIRTFPLPSFYPNNPISLFHVLYAWTKQTFFPPPAEPSVVYEGIWSPQSKSVHIVDEKNMSALWQQGFYGKGNLSRSEPNWLKREKVRRGLVPGQVSELVTANRREERRQMKWERAKSEQEAIRQMRLQEAQQAAQPAADTVNPADATIKSTVNGHDAEAVVEAISLPEPTLAPVDLEAESEPEPAAKQATSNVTKDASIITPESGVVSATFTDMVNGATSPETQASIDSTAPVEAIILPETILKPGDVLALSKTLTFTAPIGPFELLSLPNSHQVAEQNGGSEAALESIDLIIDDETLTQPGDVLPVSVPFTLSAPVGPLELIRLPNSHVALLATSEQVDTAVSSDEEQTTLASTTESEQIVPNGVYCEPLVNGSSDGSIVAAPTGPLELLSLPNTHTPLVNGTGPTSIGQKLSIIHENGRADASAESATGHLINDLVNGTNGTKVNGIDTNGAKAMASTATESPCTPKPLKRRKSVRFSPKVESATYQLSDPPSPSYALLNGKSTPPVNGTPLGPSVLEAEEETMATTNGVPSVEPEVVAAPEPTEVVNKEHLQLTTEEAFFLSFGLGALKIVDPTTKAVIPPADLFTLFRQNSYFPARDVSSLQPDDGFLVNYAVYHHFRSMGWVPRAGIKFGVDWLLYAKGPVFDHAEFGAIILPSYSDQWWKDSDRELPRKTWPWLHGVVRVLSHVQKSLVLVYVDVPPPPRFDEALKKGGPALAFKQYKIREVMVKRWSSNRNR
ncbi:tRNA intron endonuclease [Colletotrichum musicola]|uniref:tRNA-intron lyase n=1 Tax=Colletotrichum musicola TaxID=2175873 RepID=A0A8H6KUP8_9PEZI|nr:tRNA intron endonuclease [Colletotrichum musicola]